MNQSLQYEVLEVMPTATDANLGLFEHALCTIQQRTNTVSNTGQPNLTDWDDITGLVLLPCMFSIQRSLLPNQGATQRMAQQFDTETEYHILLNGYYPQILQKNRAMVNGTAYEIMAVESDSQQVMTRLACRVYNV